MNITIKINDELCRDARHRAVDAGVSLSGWIAGVIRKELSGSRAKQPMSLLEALGNEQLSEVDIEFPRNASTLRPTDLS